MTDYIIASTLVTDELRSAKEERVKTAAGGAGIYALCGIKLWNDQVMPVTGVGEDFEALYGPWFHRNHISTDGLTVKDKHTPYNIVQYDPRGGRREIPRYGPEHYQKMETSPKELEPYIQAAKGIYLFKNTCPDFWNELLPMLENRKAKILWEIADDAARPEYLPKVREIAEKIDVFSINLEESCRLLGVRTIHEAAKQLKTWKTGMIFLRQGSAGAVMVTPEETVSVPPADHVQVMDVTGGGNSSSGAVLYGYCCGRTPKECGMMGSIAAAMCLEQFGVPEQIDDGRRKKAVEQLKCWKEKEVGGK